MNNREYYRFSILDNAKFRLSLPDGSYSTAWGDCFVLDISGGGVRMTTPYKIPIETALIDLIVTVRNEEFVLHAEIAWNAIDPEKNLNKYGLLWRNLSKKKREKLIRALVQRDLELRKKR